MPFKDLLYRLRCKHESAELEKLEKQRREYRLFNDPVVVEDALVKKTKAILANLDSEQEQAGPGSLIASLLQNRVTRGNSLHGIGDTVAVPLYVSESLPGRSSSFLPSAGKPRISPEDVLCVGEDYLDPRGYKPGGIKK